MSTMLNLAQAKDCVDAMIDRNVPCFLWGTFGIGKSDLVRQIGAERKWKVIDFRASLRDPVDLRGVPFPNEKTGTTKWLVPDELPQEKRDGKRCILFMDELNVAPQSMQAACYSLVLDRYIGEYRLPDGCVIIAAGNRLSDRAAAQRMPTALANRFAHLDIVPDLETYCAWANKNKISEYLIGFLRFRRNLLHVMPQGDEKATPSPRSWSQASKFLDIKDKEVRFQCVAANVGEGAASELEAFIEMHAQCPRLNDVLADPDHVGIPNEPAIRWATSIMLARAATRKNFADLLRYMKRFPEKEYVVCFVGDAKDRDETLVTTAAYSDYINKYQKAHM